LATADKLVGKDETPQEEEKKHEEWLQSVIFYDLPAIRSKPI